VSNEEIGPNAPSPFFLFAEILFPWGGVARSVLRTAVLLAYAPRSTAVRSTFWPQGKNPFGVTRADFSDSL
jgi:hypothetical protein